MYFETYQKLKRWAELFPESLDSLTENEFERIIREKKGECANGIVHDDSSYNQHYGT